MRLAKRVIAMIGVIILAALYILTLVSAIVDRSESMHFFIAAVSASVVIPVLIWTVTFFMDRNRKDINEDIKYSSFKDTHTSEEKEEKESESSLK